MVLDIPNQFDIGIFGEPLQLDVFGQSGLRFKDIGARLDFEFGDIVAVNNPGDQTLQKFEGNFFFGHTFNDDDGLNLAVWNSRIDDATGTYSVTGNKLVLDSPALNDNVRVVHFFRTRQTIAGDLIFEARIKNNAGGASANMKFGMGDTAGGPFSDDFLIFELVNANTWRPMADRNGTTITGSNITIPNNTWNTFKIIMETDSVKFYVNNVLKETMTGANVPDDQDMQMGFQSDHEGDTANMSVEWCKVEWGA